MAKEFSPAVFAIIERNLTGKGRNFRNPKKRDMARHPILPDSSIGSHTAKLIKKRPKGLKHTSADDIYRRTTILKKLNWDSAIHEVVAASLIGLASASAGEPVSKVHFAQGSPVTGPIVSTRFHDGFRSIYEITNAREDTSRLDSGAALAKTFWISDHDAHSRNIGVVDGKVVRIDFDFAFDKKDGNMEFILQRSMVQSEFFNFFEDSLSRQSFADEMARLSSMDYYDSPQFTAILNGSTALYRQHAAPLLISDSAIESIKTQVKENFKRNSIEMKFAIEAVRINILLKKPGELSAADMLEVKQSLDRLKQLKREYPAFAYKAMANAATIFGIVANQDSSPKHVQLMVCLKMSDPAMYEVFDDGVNRGYILQKAKNPNDTNFREAVGHIKPANVEYFRKMCSGLLSDGWSGGGPLAAWRRWSSYNEGFLNLRAAEIVAAVAPESPVDKTPEEIKNILILDLGILDGMDEGSFAAVIAKIQPADAGIIFPGAQFAELNRQLVEKIEERVMRLPGMEEVGARHSVGEVSAPDTISPASAPSSTDLSASPGSHASAKEPLSPMSEMVESLFSSEAGQEVMSAFRGVKFDPGDGSDKAAGKPARKAPITGLGALGEPKPTRRR